MSDARSEGIKVFTELQNSLKETKDAFTRLAAEQNQQCQSLQDASEKASKMAVEASEAFSASKPRLMAWTTLCVALLVSGGLFAGYTIGRHDGWGAGAISGRQEALTANAAASWANTTSGKMAKQLDDIGNLQAIASCNLAGFAIQKANNGVRWCVIAGTDKQFHGWALP